METNPVVTIDTVKSNSNVMLTVSKTGNETIKFVDKKSFVEKWLADPANVGKSKADAARAHFTAKGDFLTQNGAATGALLGTGKYKPGKTTLLKNGNVNVQYIHEDNLKEPSGKRASRAKTLEEQAADIANSLGLKIGAVDVLAKLREMAADIKQSEVPEQVNA